jgi:preprotein translocase SecF subunit
MYVRGKEVKFRLVGDKALRPPNLYWFALSGALIVLSLVALLVLGVNLGIEFKGGYLLKVRLEKPADVEEVRGILGQYSSQGLDKAIVQTSEGGYTLTLRMPYIEESEQRKETIDAVESQLEGKYGIEEVLQEEQVGSEWGREVSRKALIALGVFVVFIIIFISLRLEFKMAIAGVAALIHDTLITVGIYALTGRQVTPVTVIAFLTILGYSLYDTIVVFDRVEENSNLYAGSGKIAFADLVNESVNQTLLRSIGTTLTTLLPIITILIFGGETLKDFAFALLLGVFLGAYSSVFLASPILAMWKEREPRHAVVRQKIEARGGAREAILISRAGSRAEGGAKAAVGGKGKAAPAKKNPLPKPRRQAGTASAFASSRRPRLPRPPTSRFSWTVAGRRPVKT